MKLKRTSGRGLARVLEQLGWRVDRIKGSHHIMTHPQLPRVTLSIPVHSNRTLPIGALTNILKDAQVDAEQYDELA